MYHYTYLLQSKIDDMMYIGVRSCECMPKDDNYWGSSKHLPRGKGKNLSDICDKFILGRFESREDAVADEIRRHEENDVVVSDLFWNKAKQTATRFDTTGANMPHPYKGIPQVEWCLHKKPTLSPEETKFKKGMTPWNKNSKGLMPTPWNYGKSGYLSEETIKKMSISRKGVSPWNKGKSNCFSEDYLQQLSERMKGKPSPMKGKHHTDEAREKLRVAHTGKILSDTHKQSISSANKGRPKPTRTEKHKKNLGAKMKNRKWYNNGINVVFCHEGKQPGGYELGRVSVKLTAVGTVSIST